MSFLDSFKVAKFFADNGIGLQDKKLMTSNEVDQLFWKACELGKTFSGFILAGVINADRNGIETNFDSQNDLYDCYTCYVIGAEGAGVS